MSINIESPQKKKDEPVSSYANPAFLVTQLREMGGNKNKETKGPIIAVLAFDIIRTFDKKTKSIIYRCVEVNGIHAGFYPFDVPMGKDYEDFIAREYITKEPDSVEVELYENKVRSACLKLLNLYSSEELKISDSESEYFDIFFDSLQDFYHDFTVDLNIAILSDHIIPILARAELREYAHKFVQLLEVILLSTDKEGDENCDLGIEFITDDKKLQIPYVDVRCFTLEDLDSENWYELLTSSTGGWYVKKRDGCANEENYRYTNKELLYYADESDNPKEYIRSLLERNVMQEWHKYSDSKGKITDDQNNFRVHVKVEIEKDKEGGINIDFLKATCVEFSKEVKVTDVNLSAKLLRLVVPKIRQMSIDSGAIAVNHNS